MTILSMVQNITKEMALSVPSAIINSSDNQVRQLQKIIERVGDTAVSRFGWSQLIKRHSFTLTAADATYALPTDFDRFVPDSMWDQTNSSPLTGPISPQEFEWRTYGIGGTSPYVRFNVRGPGSQKINLYPTPGSADTYSFLYFSKNWILPVIWTASTAFSADDYCSYEGNIYKTSSAGTSGSTAPTHTSGSASDGGITWAYQDMAYPRFLADTDFSLIDEQMLELGAEADFAYRNGLQYEKYAADYERMVRRQSHALNGGKSVVLGGYPSPYLLGYWNVPETGFGS